MLSTTDEIVQCASATLRCWITGQDIKKLQSATNLAVECSKHIEVIPKDERDDLKVSVKIYLRRFDPACIKEAVESALSYIGISDIETVLLAFQDHTFCSERIPLDVIEPLWQVLEEYVEHDVIVRLGVCDFNRDQLEELMNIAKVTPAVNQLNFKSTEVLRRVSQGRVNPAQMPTITDYKCEKKCTGILDEMIEWARSCHLELLTHNDNKDILPNEDLQAFVGKAFSPKDGLHWTTDWVVRYSALLENRAVVRCKGYLLCATRDLEKSSHGC